MNNTHNSVSFPAKTCAGRTATAQTSRGFLSPTKKDSFVQLPTLNSALSWWRPGPGSFSGRASPPRTECASASPIFFPGRSSLGEA